MKLQSPLTRLIQCFQSVTPQSLSCYCPLDACFWSRTNCCQSLPLLVGEGICRLCGHTLKTVDWVQTIQCPSLWLLLVKGSTCELRSMTLSPGTHPAGSCWFMGKQVLELPIGTWNWSGSRPQLSYLFHLWFLSCWINVTPQDGRCSIWTINILKCALIHWAAAICHF